MIECYPEYGRSCSQYLILINNPVQLDQRTLLKPVSRQSLDYVVPLCLLWSFISLYPKIDNACIPPVMFENPETQKPYHTLHLQRADIQVLSGGAKLRHKIPRCLSINRWFVRSFALFWLSLDFAR